MPTHAETMRRWVLPAWAMALRMKWTRQRCQVAFRIFEIAAFRPSWASETTSLTPRRQRQVNERSKSTQKGSASLCRTVMPCTSRHPSLLMPTATMTATDTI